MSAWKIYPPSSGNEVMAVHQTGTVLFLTLWRFIPFVFRVMRAGDRIEVAE